MISGAFAATLRDRGLETSESDGKRSLFALLLDAFRAAAPGHLESESPQHVWWVPGRLEVFGKHTDYAGGRTLVCAVPRGIALAATPRKDDLVHVIDARHGDDVLLRPAAVESGHHGWRHYVEVVARRLARNFPGSGVGATLVFASDLPRASGMSSSSALVVGIAAALVRVAGLQQRAEWKTNIRNTIDEAGYYACLENGLTFGTLAGDAGVGTHGGSEDHVGILAGQASHVSAFAFVPVRPLGIARMPDEWRFVIAPSAVTSEKTGAAQESYNQLASSAQALLDLWNQTEPPASSLGAALWSSPFAAERLRDLVWRSQSTAPPADALERRLDHFIREDERVIDALTAFQNMDIATLSDLSEQSQRDAETLLGNQIAETVTLARSARTLGAFAACSFGAGFGGSVWALVDSLSAEPFAKRWHPGAFVARPGPPLTQLK